MKLTMVRILLWGLLLLFIITNTFAENLIIRPRKDSDVLSNQEKIRVVKEFGDWLDSCNFIIIGKDTQEKIQSCKYMQYFMEYGWKYPFSAI